MKTGLRTDTPVDATLSLAWRALIVLAILFSLTLCSVFRDELQRWIIIVGAPTQVVDAQQINPRSKGPFELAPLRLTKVAEAELDVTFTPTDTSGLSDVFQTADGNEGIRAELSGKILAVVYTPLDTSRDALVGAAVSSSIEPGVTHRLRLWINTNGVTSQFDSGDRKNVTAAVPNISFSHLLVGSGFDATRPFKGTIDQFKLSMRAGRSPMFGVVVYFLIRCLIFASFLVAVWLLFSDVAVQHPAAVAHIVRVPPSQNDPLLGLRGLAFLCVLFGHWFMVVFKPADLASLVERGSPVWLLTASPWGGVWIFFTLSGYLMGKGFVTQRYGPDHSGFARFYKNRALRILPMYFTATLLIGLFVHPEIFVPSESSAVDDVLSVLLFDNQGALPIGALWSVSTEAQFYLMVPFLYLALRPLMASTARSIILALVLIAASIIVNGQVLTTAGMGQWHVIYYPLAANLPIFLVGFLMAFATQSVRALSLRIRSGVLVGSFLATTMYVGLAWWSAHGMLLADESKEIVFLSWAPIITSIVTAAIIFIFECSVHSLGRLGSGRRLMWGLSSQLGLLTYALYVWHEPILVSIRKLAPATLTFMSSALYLLYAVPALIVVAVMFYRQIELPFDRMKKPSAAVNST